MSMRLLSNPFNFCSLDIFAPWIAFPFLYILYFIFGSLKLTKLTYPSYKSTFLIFIALIFYILGSYMFIKYCDYKKISLKNDFVQNKWLEKPIHILVITSLSIILISILIQSFLYGIPILHPEIRGGVSLRLLPSGILFALFGLLPLSLTMFLSNRLDKQASKLSLITILFLGEIAALFTAYRTPVVIFSISFILLINYLYKKIAIKRLLLFSALLGTIIVCIQLYRDYMLRGQKGVSSYLSGLSAGRYPDALIAAHLNCREGAIVFSDIVDRSSVFGLLHGDLFRMIFETMLPGTQLGPRTFISLFRGTSLASSTTPSILGEPYLDFGIPGITISMFLLGVVLTFLYLSLIHSSEDPFCRKINAVSYSYCLSVTILSIHSGLLDPVIILSIIFIIFLQNLACGWLKNKYILTIWILALTLAFITIFSIIINPTISNEESNSFEFCNNNLNSTIYLDDYLSMTAITFQNQRFQTININTKSLNEIIKRIKAKHIAMYIGNNYLDDHDIINQFEGTSGIDTIYANSKIKIFNL
jgi:oligosaccharide repeat unit polymerase